MEVLPYKVVLKIQADVLLLAKDPFPPGHKKLKGPKDMYRIRVANYRIIYTIHHQAITVEILKVAHQKEIYD